MNLDFRIPLGDWASAGVDWLTSTFAPLFNVLRTIFLAMFEGLNWVLVTPPSLVIIIVLAAVAWFSKGWRLGVGTAIGLLVIVGVNQWQNAMDTLALTIVAAIIALIIAI